MATKQLTNYEKAKLYYERAKVGAARGYQATKRGVQVVGKEAASIGRNLSSSGETIGKSFNAPNIEPTYINVATGSIIQRPLSNYKVVSVDNSNPNRTLVFVSLSPQSMRQPMKQDDYLDLGAINNKKKTSTKPKIKTKIVYVERPVKKKSAPKQKIVYVERPVKRKKKKKPTQRVVYKKDGPVPFTPQLTKRQRPVNLGFGGY